MKEVADIVAADTTSTYDSRAADPRPWGMGKYTVRPTIPYTRRDCPSRLQSVRIAAPAGWPPC
jgi:hypothetical protein